MLGTYHLNSLFDILKEIHFIYEPSKLWKFVLEKACSVIQAEAGSFYQLADDGQTLQLAASYGVDDQRIKQVPFQVGVGICGWVAQYLQPALVADVRQDNRFNQGADIVTGFRTKSILCVPLLASKRSYGVLEILNKRNGLFAPQDQEFMTLLGRQTAVAYQNLNLLSEVRESKVLVESIVNNLTGGLIAINQDNRVTLMNPSAIRLLHLAEGSSAGKPVTEVLRHYPWFIDTLLQTQKTQQNVSRQETDISVEGVNTRFGYTTIVIADAQKNLLGSGIIFQKLL